MMFRFLSRVLVASAVLWGVLLLTGCPQSRPVKQPKTQSKASTNESTAVMQYGPVYSVRTVKDPVVIKTLKGAEKTDTPVISAEIRGFLVDWVINESTDHATMRELAIMKDGSLYSVPMHRPSAAFGAMAPSRLTPEPPREARARKASLVAAHKAVAKMYPPFASVKPIVYGYLVRLHHKDGSNVDVWVDPDVGHQRFFYNIRLNKVEK